MTADQAKAIAEGYLQARGLLNFSYEVRQGYVPSEVYFHRVIDGRPVNQPEIWVSLIGDQIGTIGYSVLRAPAELGNYRLISAEAAWQQLIEKATVAGNVLYEMMPSDMNTPDTFVEEPVAVDQPLYWPRVYQPGQEAHLYTWPTIYVSAEGNAVARIETYPLALQASDETLNGIAASGSRMFHIWGTVGADGKTLEVAGFEAMDENVDHTVFVEGTIGREGDQVVVTAFTGEKYILLNAPADVPEGLEITVFGFASRDAGLTYPVLEWDNISERVVYEEQPVVEEPITTMPVDIWEPYIYQNVTVDKVEVAYYYTYVHDEEAMARGEYTPATILLQPVWKFSGTAENGDQLTFYIQAVAADHIQN